MDGSPTLLRPGEPSFLPLSVSVECAKVVLAAFSRRQSAQRTQDGWLVSGSGRTKDGLQAKEAVRTLIAA